ncbi:hypothetical protein [Fructobacillus sp. CRL 2054]|nr:hypothetical protein [Fructobacillus sp. CRL 2054]
MIFTIIGVIVGNILWLLTEKCSIERSRKRAVRKILELRDQYEKE